MIPCAHSEGRAMVKWSEQGSCGKVGILRKGGQGFALNWEMLWELESGNCGSGGAEMVEVG